MSQTSVMLLRRAFGHCLRVIRLRQGLTLQQVADAAGVSLAHLSAIERGLSEASSEILAAICEALGVAMPDLLDAVRREFFHSTTPGWRDQYELAA